MMAAAWVLGLLALLIGSGPRPRRLRLDPELPSAAPDPAAVERAVQAREAALPVRPDNQARVLWAGQPGLQTPLCFVYLHGYSACWREGSPIHSNTAKRYGANLLLTRLHEHGLERAEPLMDLQASELWADAKQALAEALVLGREVILLATSSAAPLAEQLAIAHPDKVKALVLFSPNHRMREPGSWVLDWPWGLHLARIVKKGKHHRWNAPAEQKPYWYDVQRLEGAVQLQVLVRKTRKRALVAPLRCPVWMGSYYKDEAHQDATVHVSEARRVFEALGTPPGQKRFQCFDSEGAHVISCDITNPRWLEVQAGAWDFLDAVVGLRPVAGQG